MCHTYVQYSQILFVYLSWLARVILLAWWKAAHIHDKKKQQKIEKYVEPCKSAVVCSE